MLHRVEVPRDASSPAVNTSLGRGTEEAQLIGYSLSMHKALGSVSRHGGEYLSSYPSGVKKKEPEFKILLLCTANSGSA